GGEGHGQGLPGRGVRRHGDSRRRDLEILGRRAVRHPDLQHGDFDDLHPWRGQHLVNAHAHPLAWQAPRPLWRGETPFAAAPQILRFASDDFMDQVIATLQHEPARLSERIVKPETWRTPLAQTATTDMVQRVALPAPLVEAKR